MICGGMDIENSFSLPANKHHVRCRSCGRGFNRKRVLTRKTDFGRTRLPGFRRTKFSEKLLEDIVAHMTDLINLKELFLEDKLQHYVDFLVNEKGWPKEGTLGLVLTAAKRSKWNNNDYISERVESETGNRAEKMSWR